MTYKKIITFFATALPACVLMRFLQIVYTVEFKTGFFTAESQNYGYYILAVIAAIGILTAVFSFLSHRSPENPPRVNILMGIVSILFSAALFYSMSAENYTAAVMPIIQTFLKIAQLCAGVYFLIFGLSAFVKMKLPPFFSVFPSIYVIVRVICDFSNVSTLAFISDYAFLLAANCVGLLFFVSFAKVYNKADTELNFRKLMATGLSGSILCFTQSVPHLAVNAVTGGKYLHTSIYANLEILFMGIFILVYTLLYFSKKNAC